MGKKTQNILLLGWEEEGGMVLGVGQGVVSEFPEAGDVYLLSTTEHLHVKKAQFLCGFIWDAFPT